MSELYIQTGQSLIDIAMQESGKAENAWTLAESLGVDLTDAVEGRSLELQVSHLFGKAAPLMAKPASEPTEGIGYWSVGQGMVSGDHAGIGYWRLPIRIA